MYCLQLKQYNNLLGLANFPFSYAMLMAESKTDISIADKKRYKQSAAQTKL